MKVLITGATGLIGQAIVKQCLAKGWVVHYLTTSKSKIENSNTYKGFYWNPKDQVIDEACFDGVDTIINLAGASIAKRWTESYKQTILDSRIDTLRLLYSKLSTTKHTVKQLISASAIGAYPDSLTNYYEEDFPKYSNSFLGAVVEKWEAETDAFKALDITVSKVRIGLVLDAQEGALPQIVKPTKFGMGAAFGSGKQWQSWIHVEDLAGIFMYVAQHQLVGVFNGVAPNPVSNTELTKAVASTLKRPLILPNIPKVMMKLVLGEMHILLFESQRVSSKKIENTGFEFQFVNLKPALEDLL
ncbi:TIGR01777 family protein [Hanstruepera neustonica]|uniref:TIGR01777 family protein n=1 Tax=Hanstruepera neustonica TaxID=1445657 RepID=A0A2K1DZK7_9FLAO|nr:TIGR01777 family oxidoreductase [Hanstruepera neustonica]PNQ73472.1 TIGR01777 family protein [Hanstruepera neustonica]